ncbi:MAG: hypothetical protein KGD61_09655 [Candidatus Lokiarchaeota archaeon]|nr:hypothetical protein [Candidatus Lokiarchaeota archaeon]
MWNIIGFLIFYFGKKRITIPRIGYVKFGKEHQAKKSKLTMILVGFFILNVVLLFVPMTGVLDYVQIDHLILSLFLGLGVFTFPFCIVAYFLDFTRLYYYAIFIGIGLFLAELLTPVVGIFLDTGLVFGIIGAAILVIGVINLIQFLKKYPLQEEGVE